MKAVRIVLSMALFVPAFTLFGLSGWGGDWYGGVVGGMIGAFFGMVFSGEAKGRWLDLFYPPGQTENDEEKNFGEDRILVALAVVA